jgi:hexosaminidase
MRAFVGYAYLRGVRVIPEFDSPAHFGTLQYAYPELTALAYDGQNNSFACLVDPSKQATFDMLSAVWGEVGSIFSDATFMIGGDEVRAVRACRSVAGARRHSRAPPPSSFTLHVAGRRS